MAASPPAVTWERTGEAVLRVTLRRPPANALGLPLIEGLNQALDEAADAPAVKTIVVVSELPAFFAAGADIKYMAKAGAADFAAYGRALRAVLDRLAAPRWLSIAAVEGLALGGGLELALACTLRVAGAGARFGLPEVKLGLIPGAGGTQRLPRLVGRGRALDIMLTGRQVGADEAHAIGLVSRWTGWPGRAGSDGAGRRIGPCLPGRPAGRDPHRGRFLRDADAGWPGLRGRAGPGAVRNRKAKEGITAFLEKRPQLQLTGSGAPKEERSCTD